MPSGIRETLYGALRKFSQIEGAQAAAAFAHYTLFSLFPLTILLVTLASFFVDRNQAEAQVIAYIKVYVSLTRELQNSIFDTITGVINARGQAGIIAFLLLVWSAQQFFTTLISTTNRAWGVVAYNWWQLPLKCLQLLSIMAFTVLLGIGMQVVVRGGPPLFPLFVVFLSLVLFYRLAPNRPIRLNQVWVGALCATALLQMGESLFVIYIKTFADLNVVYGTFGGVIALLLWIYVSGGIVLFGACLCAAQSEYKKHY